MVGRATRRKPEEHQDSTNSHTSAKAFPANPSAPASNKDKTRWQGFCEIESEPAFFNVMLRDFGVQGVKVQEVVSLDDEILRFLPRPVYGLIFLFRWMEEDPDKQEQSCPEGVWFANQTINNACASVALLNIVNNIPNIELGDNLHAFKEFTADFSPALKGDAIGNFEFVKCIHNSFARKMDMLNSDLLLKNEATTKARSKKRNLDEGESEPGFHFIAFMPIKDELWKLDGLERQPMCLGSFKDDWLSQAKPDIEARMAQYEEFQIEFAILSLICNPLIKLIAKLAENIKSIASLTTRLDAVKSDWRDFDMPSVNGESETVLTGPDAIYEVMKHDLELAKVSEHVARLCQSEIVEDIIAQRQQLISQQAGIRLSIRDEQQSNKSDEERAAARRCDYGARMQDFVRRVKTRKQGNS